MICLTSNIAGNLHPAMRTQRIEERFAFSGGRVDRTGAYPIIRDALLCGSVSANGRDYPARAFAGSRIKRYESKSVFLNHAVKPNTARDIRDKIAWIENARHREDGMPIGDIGFNPKHPEAESVLWVAENKPGFCGLSHVAHCRTTRKNGRDVVEEIIGVESVDIVVDPATTQGFFEHTSGAKSMTTIQEMAKASGASAKLKTLLGIGKYGTVQVSEEDTMGGEEGGVSAAVKAAASAEIEECMASIEAGSGDAKSIVKACLGRLKKILHLHGDLNEKPEDEEPAEPTEEPKDEKPVESKSIGYDKALTICSEAKYMASPMEVKALARMDSDADAKAYIAEQTAKGAERKPVSTGRTTIAAPPKTTVKTEQRRIPAWDVSAN